MPLQTCSHRNRLTGLSSRLDGLDEMHGCRQTPMAFERSRDLCQRVWIGGGGGEGRTRPGSRTERTHRSSGSRSRETVGPSTSNMACCKPASRWPGRACRGREKRTSRAFLRTDLVQRAVSAANGRNQCCDSPRTITAIAATWSDRLLRKRSLYARRVAAMSWHTQFFPRRCTRLTTNESSRLASRPRTAMTHGLPARPGHPNRGVTTSRRRLTQSSSETTPWVSGRPEVQRPRDRGRSPWAHLIAGGVEQPPLSSVHATNCPQ
jgi:hypothetical protein